jgi:hypothetical protein
MGAWGIGVWENDNALDWAYELEDCNDLSVISRSIELILDSEEIDSIEADEALAAIDVLARLKHQDFDSDGYDEEISEWIKTHKDLQIPDSLWQQAKQALDKIVSEDSELYELWQESDSFEAWKKEMDILRGRMG